VPHTTSPPSSDAALLLAARRDARAFQQLYVRHAQRIYAQHLRATRDEHAAHDLTAETFAEAWLVRGRFRDEAGGSALPWLLGIARNVLLMSIRRRTLEQRACERLGLRERLDGPPASLEPTDEWLSDFDAMLEDLPERHREALRLRVLEDLDYADVGAALGTSPQAARVRVHRALQALRTRLIEPKELRP
jgi:RNA polymerase sigma factor (sigma-70 family)